MPFSIAETSLPLAFRIIVFPFLGLFWSSTLVSAQTQSFNLNPIKNFCSRWYAQSVVKNSVLYIDSGIQKYGDVWNEPDPIIGINNWLITIPLDFTWDWKTNIKIDGEPKNESNPSTGTIPPSLIRGHMFHGPANTAEVYRYGGTTYQGNQSFPGYIRPDSSTYSLWTYNHETSNYPWAQYDISQPWISNHGAAAEAIDQSLGFYLNGQTDWGTSTKTMNILNSTDLYRPLPGMLVMNFTDHTSKNVSTSKLRGNAPRVGGSMEYFPDVGNMGVLVALGGQINNGTPWANATKGELLDFNAVDVWDINSYLEDPSSNGNWYQQTTSGNIPPARIDFCTVSISAPDNSSHNIYLYGGIDPTLHHDGYDDVYVLSIPSFIWTPIFTDGASPRWGHNCHVAGNRQMLTVGGNISHEGVCDWESKGVAVLDMTNVTWGSVFVSDQGDYQVPQAVISVTGGNGMGGATVKEPAKGWTDSALKTIFNTTRGESGTTPSPSPTNTSAAGKKTSIAGPVAGGVVGGVVALALIAGLLMFLRRRHNKKNAPKELHSESIRPEDSRTMGETGSGKDTHHELQAVNERDPVELAGPEAQELNAPREFAEADSNNTATQAAELSGTSIAPGGTAGVPQLRIPGDDLPETPIYTPGLRRRSSTGSRRRQKISNTAQGEPPNIDQPPKSVPKHDPI